MSATYQPVSWNRNKIAYDAVLIVAITVYLALFMTVAPRFVPETKAVDEFVLRIRAFGSCTFLLLTAILCIGPLARLDRRWLPVLYNRRHFGVLTAVTASGHVAAVLAWYYSFSPVEPWIALLSSNTTYARAVGFPFELFGLLAFAILLVMAATSHDFWLSFLGPPLWKALHMGVYLAWTAIVLHVALGPLQTPGRLVLGLVVAAAVVLVGFLHVASAWRGRAEESAMERQEAAWAPVAAPADFIDGHARTVQLADGARVAVFRNGEKLSAVENACKHQNGPLGEGRIIDGCITCPWHGFQYRPKDGCAPPPFTEKLMTYRLRLREGRVEVDPRPNPPGTYVEPLLIPEQT